MYVRSFADADGDGVGDLPGITERLPYLRGLGVDAVWLTPFYRSPMADAGYDVADPRDVDPMFGSLADFDALLAHAHALGLRVLVDVVPNHTSSQHAWFRAAVAAGPGSPERERYLFRKGRGGDGELPPNDWVSVFGGAAWTRLPVPDGEWYLHLFAPEQPDVNWSHPEVAAEYEAVLRFWLDRGVDGFRIDVAHGLIKAVGLPDAGPVQHPRLLRDRPPLPQWDQDGVHEIYRRWRSVAASYPGERVLVGEAWVHPVERLARYVRPDELHQAFNFEYLQMPWDSGALRQVISDTLAALAGVGAGATWVLSNHDVERHRTRLGGGLRRANAALLLMLALPGCAYLYQGEELGLPQADVPDWALADPVWERSGRTERGRDGARVPMPWSGTRPPFGFSPPGAAPPWLPMPAEWRSLTVEAQDGDPGSALTLYRAALALRRAEPAFRSDEFAWEDGAGAGGLVAFRRPASGGGILCAANTGRSAVPVPAAGRVLLASGPLGGAADRGGGALLLPPDTTVWCRC